MAISKEIWDKAKFYFETGKSITYISDELGISRGQISKKSKSDNWEKGNKKKQLKTDIVDFEKKNETLLQEKETLVHKLAELEDYEITLMNDLVYEETKKATLVNSTAMLALIRTNQMLTKNKKQSMTKVKTYDSDGKINGEQIELFEIELEPKDIKDIIDGTDKASITLKHNERHAKSSVEVNNTNAQQTNVQEEITISIKE